MNKLIIALSVACASACVFADSTVGATPKTETTPWFSAVANPEAITGGNFNAKPDIVEGKFVIDSELTKPVTFTPTNSVAQDLTEVSFTLDTAIVPFDARTTSLGDTAKVAFAVSENEDGTAKGYYAWLGGDDWVSLGGTPKADGESYTLVVTFDKAAQKVQFKVGDTVLSDGWLSYTTPVTGAMAIDFVGSGNVASFGGSQIAIVAEVVADPELGPIEIPEADAKLLAKDTTLEAALQIDASKYGLPEGKYTVGTAYAIGLIKAENGEMKKQADGIVVKASATAMVGDDNMLPVEFVGFTPKAQGNNVELSYQLKGETGDGKWENVGDSATDIEDIKIPANDVTGDKKYRYFKVVTTVGVPANK